MATPRIPLAHEALAAFCRRNGIRSLSFFGSVLRDDFSDESDVDVLIEFEPGRIVGYLRFAGLEDELSQLLGRKVDLKTAAMLSPYFRDEVLREASPIYDDEQQELGRGARFWQLVRERRGQPAVSRAELESLLGGND